MALAPFYSFVRVKATNAAAFCCLYRLPVHDYYDQLLPQLAALPGVRDASAGYPLPLAGVYRSAPVEIDGRQNPPDSSLTTLVGVAQPNFFETLEIPLLHGRNFSIQDNSPKSPLVTIVNQTFVKQFFPNENPIGHHIRPHLTELRNQAKDIDSTAAQERESSVSSPTSNNSSTR